MRSFDVLFLQYKAWIVVKFRCSTVTQDVFCSTKPSWQGDRCAPPLHPPGRGFDQALSHPKPKTYRRFTTRGRLRSPCTHRLGGRSCPQDPRPCHGGHFMETNPARFGCRHVMEMISSRPRTGAFALPFLGTIPSTKERVTPLGTPTNRPPIGYRHLAEDGSLPRAYRRPRTQLVGHGELPLHRHRTMHNRLPD